MLRKFVCLIGTDLRCDNHIGIAVSAGRVAGMYRKVMDVMWEGDPRSYLSYILKFELLLALARFIDHVVGSTVISPIAELGHGSGNCINV